MPERRASPSAAALPLPVAGSLAALVVLILVANLSPITNNDLFLHLKTGELVLETWRVPRVDDFSALAAGRPYVAHEWLSAVLFRLVYEVAGPAGLIWLKALTALLIAGLLYAAARRLGATPAVAVPCLAFVMLLASARIMERPHIFTYVLTAATLVWLPRLRRPGRAAPLGLLAQQVLWANLHGGFLLGPAIVGLSAAGSLFEMPRTPAAGSAGLREVGRRALLAIAMLAASLVNPYGWRLLAFPFALTGSTFMREIYEWLPPFRSAFAGTNMARAYIVWAVFGATVLLIAARRARAHRGEARHLPTAALLFVFFFALSLRMNRNVTDFALVTFPSVAALASGLLPAGRAVTAGRRWLAWLSPAFLGLAAWIAAYGYPYTATSRRAFGFGLGEEIPVAAADYLEENQIRGAVFNSYSVGAYLVFRLYPGVRVAMDSRNDVYGEDLYAAYTRALRDGEALRALLQRIDAAAIVLEWPLPGAAATGRAIVQAGDWVPVSFDDRVIVLLRADGPWAALVRRDGYALLNPMLYRPGMLRPAEATAALAEATRAARRGGSWVARVMMIDALLTLGRQAEAFDEEARILKDAPRLYYIYNYLGLIRLGLGDAQKAASRFRWALELNPESAVARDGLRRCGS